MIGGADEGEWPWGTKSKGSCNRWWWECMNKDSSREGQHHSAGQICAGAVNSNLWLVNTQNSSSIHCHKHTLLSLYSLTRPQAPFGGIEWARTALMKCYGIQWTKETMRGAMKMLERGIWNDHDPMEWFGCLSFTSAPSGWEWWGWVRWMKMSDKRHPNGWCAWGWCDCQPVEGHEAISYG